MKQTLLPLIVLAACAGSVFAQAPAPSSSVPTLGSTAKKYHAIFDMNEAGPGDAWDSLVVHVTNMKAVLDKEGGVEVEVVFYGPGLAMLTKRGGEKYEQALKTLAEQGVKLLACQNAMKYLHIASEDLFPFAGEVDSGVAQLVRRQNQGWALIK